MRLKDKVGVDGMTPCFKHLVTKNCANLNCGRSHDANAHQFTASERAAIDEELERRKKNRDSYDNGKGGNNGNKGGNKGGKGGGKGRA